jgi:hypothetical protein
VLIMANSALENSRKWVGKLPAPITFMLLWQVCGRKCVVFEKPKMCERTHAHIRAKCDTSHVSVCGRIVATHAL